MWQFDGLMEMIEQSDIITLFRHEHPDCDAVGSQFGLKNWIEENWPEKRVYALGNEYCAQGNCWPESDYCSNSDIEQSLAIVLDTANRVRADDARFQSAAHIIKIDHHPNHDPYGERLYVFEGSAATCEILAEFFRQNSDRHMSLATAEYLFRGLLTDTLSFRTTNTTSHTLFIAGWLADYGVRISDLNRQLFDVNLEDYKFANVLRRSLQIRGGRLAYRIVSIDEMREWDMTISATKNFIEEFGNVREFEIYCIFCEKRVNDVIYYDGSLRSKHVVINKVLESYGGGGHANACGIKNLSFEKMNELLDDLYTLIPH